MAIRGICAFRNKITNMRTICPRNNKRNINILNDTSKIISVRTPRIGLVFTLSLHGYTTFSCKLLLGYTQSPPFRLNSEAYCFHNKYCCFYFCLKMYSFSSIMQPLA